jgi:hypothetical protein
LLDNQAADDAFGPDPPCTAGHDGFALDIRYRSSIEPPSSTTLCSSVMGRKRRLSRLGERQSGADRFGRL